MPTAARLQPDIIVNNRVGKARAGMEGMDKGKGLGDYGTPEQNVPANGFGPGVYWESCMTMNNHWGYNKHDNHWKSTDELIHILVDCSSKGGNYLLNVGPTSEGLIPAQRRAAQGHRPVDEGQRREHLRHHRQHDRPAEWGRSTTKGDTIYLHVFDWPKDGKLVVEKLDKPVKKAWLLSDSGKKTLKILVGQTTDNAADIVSVVIDVPHGPRRRSIR